MSLLKKSKKEDKKNLCIRVSGDERDTLQAHADKFCDGNLSEWLRIAGLSWTPQAEDLKEVS